MRAPVTFLGSGHVDDWPYLIKELGADFYSDPGGCCGKRPHLYQAGPMDRNINTVDALARVSGFAVTTRNTGLDLQLTWTLALGFERLCSSIEPRCGLLGDRPRRQRPWVR